MTKKENGVYISREGDVNVRKSRDFCHIKHQNIKTENGRFSLYQPEITKDCLRK